MPDRNSATFRRVVALLLLVLLATVGFLGWPQPGLAEGEKVFHWKTYDYDVEIQPNGDMLFTVNMDIAFEQGSFTQGYFAFNMARMEDVRDVEVWEGQRQYRKTSDSGSQYTFTVTRGDDFKVSWYFPVTSGKDRSFTLKYRIVGGLRIYDGGDQFYWNFYSGERPARVDQGTIRVVLPADVAPENLILAANPDSVSIQQTDTRTVVANVANLPANTQATLRVQFPHGLVQAEKPSWQATDDKKLEYDEKTRPWVELGMLALGVLFLVGGVGGVIALWYTRGRDKPVGVVAEYLTEPPSDLPPGLVGALVDEKVDIQDILSTLVDLARRGAMSIEEEEDKGLLGLGIAALGASKDFTYHLMDNSVAKLEYEKTLMKEIFGSSNFVQLSSLKEKFYRSIPKIARKMYKELTDRKFFYGDPDKTRNSYLAFGIFALVFSFCLFICMSVFLSKYASTSLCVPASLGIVSIVLLIASQAMAKKTEGGALEAAQWQAFKRYLEGLEHYDNVQEKADIFEKYLPYAIAFGIERDYIKKFEQVPMPAPIWYMPYPPIYHQPGYPHQTGHMTPTGSGLSGAGGLGGGTTPSLQSMSDGMASSLQSMSDGLVSMLNSASRTMTSQPKSSSSGGGHGWSGGGGGFSGGGGGGGGSGFR